MDNNTVHVSSPVPASVLLENERPTKRIRLNDGHDDRSPSNTSAEDLIAVSRSPSAATRKALTEGPREDGALTPGHESEDGPLMDAQRRHEETDQQSETGSYSDDHDHDDDQNGEMKAALATPPPPADDIRVQYQPRLLLRGHKAGVSCVRFSPDGKSLASCSADATIKIWDVSTGKHQRTLEGHQAGISTIAWSPDSRTIASGSDDKSIRLWDVVKGKAHPVPFLGHHNYVYSIAFSPKGNMLASGSYDEALFLWDVRSARMMRSLPAHSDPVGGVDFVHDGTLVVSCARDGLIRIWDTATGQCLRTMVNDDLTAVVSVRFSPNGKYVLAWTLDSCIRLWNYVEGRCVKTYQGHRNEKYGISGCFAVLSPPSPPSAQSLSKQQDDDDDDNLLLRRGRTRSGRLSVPATPLPSTRALVVSGSETGELVIWDVKSKIILQKIPSSSPSSASSPSSTISTSVRTDSSDINVAHQNVILSVDSHPIQPLLVTCSLDRTIKIWRNQG